MAHQRLGQIKSASKVVPPYSHALPGAQTFMHPVLQLQSMIGNRTVNQWLGEQPQSYQTLENRTGMPKRLKMGLETLSGLNLSDVSVHYNSAKPKQLNALAYTQGQDIHIAPGQERYLPHEAWHVVQQKQGRVKPSPQIKGTYINDDQGLEREADVMGARALHLQPSRLISKQKIPNIVPSTEVTVSSDQGNVIQRMCFGLDGTPLSKGGYDTSNETDFAEWIEKLSKEKNKLVLESIFSQLQIFGNAADKSEVVAISIVKQALNNLNSLFPENQDPNTSVKEERTQKYEQFVNSQEWRQWVATGAHGEGEGKTLTGVPPSTRRIQPRLTHITRYPALKSIRATGLDPDFFNSKTGLNHAAADKRYARRDAFIRAVYLGTTADVGSSMDEEAEKGGTVTLIVRVPPQFRDAYFRDANATVAHTIDLEKVSDSVLCFKKIPPAYIFVIDPETKKEKCILDYPEDYDWRKPATQPQGEHPPLEALKDIEAREKRIREKILLDKKRFEEQQAQEEAKTKKRNDKSRSKDSSQDNETIDTYSLWEKMRQHTNDENKKSDDDWDDDDDWE